MRDKRVLLVIFVMILAFGIAVLGCDNGTTDGGGNPSAGGGSGGVFTLTDIPPEFNGKYAYLSRGGGGLEDRGDQINIGGFQSFNTSTGFTLPQISNGRVVIPLWVFQESDNGNGGVFLRYSGNNVISVVVDIYNSATDPYELGYAYFELVQFSNGNATRSWNEGSVRIFN